VQDKQPIVVILGMHRSGTSLLANFMHAIGVNLGQDLIPADEWNAAGYWESPKVYEAQDKILKELNRNWHNPPLSLPVNWWRKSSIQELKSELLEFVRSECDRTDKIFGFKDPRTAILLPLWQEIFHELQLEPHYILAVRHPGSVAASLSRRNGLSCSHSQALWLKTNLAALSYTRNHLRAIVDYDRWFDSGLEQARTVIDSLNLSGSISEAQIAEAVNQVVFPRLLHHSCKQNAVCSPIVAKCYSLLYQATTNGKISNEISPITETIEKAMDILNIWDELVAERDSTIVERDSTIVERDAAIVERDAAIVERDAAIVARDEIIADDTRRLRKQRKRQQYSYAIIIVLVVVFMIYTFVLVGAYNWFK
jgi:hypothetical protein